MLIFTAYAPGRSSLRKIPAAMRRSAILDWQDQTAGIRSCRDQILPGSDPAGVSVPHILLHVPAFLRLMTSDETARRRADDAVMTGIVPGDTPDDRAFQTTLG
jgi:hypothetical protein